ncbi:hypothetical protein HDU96_008084 [Phlyctochytrium bullatum]|nr:hypothetical protein HDU96_008084 [Phlyctochytrium bullatum]
MEDRLVNDQVPSNEPEVDVPAPPQSPAPASSIVEDAITPPVTLASQRTSARQAKKVVPYDPSPIDTSASAAKGKRQAQKPAPSQQSKRARTQRSASTIASDPSAENATDMDVAQEKEITETDPTSTDDNHTEDTERQHSNSDQPWIVNPADLAALVASVVGKKKTGATAVVSPSIALQGLAKAIKAAVMIEILDDLREKLKTELMPEIMAEVNTLLTTKISAIAQEAEPAIESVAAFVSRRIGAAAASATVPEREKTISWSYKLDSVVATFLRTHSWDKVLVADEYGADGKRREKAYALVPLVDSAVYHRNQNFRTWGSSKWGVGGTPLLLFLAGTTLYDSGVPPPPTVEIFRQSLLTIRTAFDQEVQLIASVAEPTDATPDRQISPSRPSGSNPPTTPRAGHDNHTAGPSGNNPPTTSPARFDRTAGDQLIDPDSDGEPSRIVINTDLHNRILRALETNFGYSKKMKWTLYRKHAVIAPTEIKTCLIANRMHSSNCVYFVYMDESFSLYQKCHANKCQDRESERFSV